MVPMQRPTWRFPPQQRPPAKSDGRQCRPLVIDPSLPPPVRVNDLREVKPNPANLSDGTVAGQTLTTLHPSTDFGLRRPQGSGSCLVEELGRTHNTRDDRLVLHPQVQ